MLNVNILVDLILVLIVILCAFIGKIRGFIKTFFGFFGSLISFILASLLARPIGTFLSEHLILPIIKKTMQNRLETAMEGSFEFSDFLSTGANAASALEKFGVKWNDLLRHIEEQSIGNAQELAESVLDFVARPIASTVGHVTAFVVLFVVLSIVVKLLIKILDLIAKFPFLNFSNRFLGLAVGAVWGLLIAVIVSSVLVSVSPALQSSSQPFLSSLDPTKTYVLKFLNQLSLFHLV
jgi:uncharacterized membrane protein required for colicin V production